MTSGRDARGMSVATRPPGAELAEVEIRRILSGRRPGGGLAIGTTAPEDLLPEGDVLPGGPGTALGAAVLDAAFLASVEEVRRHLAPLRSRAALTESFSREAVVQGSGVEASLWPVQVAYALRWLELPPGRPAAGRSGRLAGHPPDGLDRILGAIDGGDGIPLQVVPLDDPEAIAPIAGQAGEHSP